jgi:hypothetical protein
MLCQFPANLPSVSWVGFTELALTNQYSAKIAQQTIMMYRTGIMISPKQRQLHACFAAPRAVDAARDTTSPT